MMSVPGEVRGSVLKKDESYILMKEGERKLKEVEKEIKEMGCAFSYKDIKNSSFYPWGERVLSLLAISMVLNMDKEKIKEMGRCAVEDTFFARFFMRYFLSLESVFQKVSRMWRKRNTIGRLEVEEIDKKRRKVVLHLYNLNFHPIFCDYLCGYFSKIGSVAQGKEVTCKEERCYFKGESPFHEFILRW